MPMNISAFEAFIRVMETKSISSAADQLFITQPAVTKRIQSLEAYFGVTLFEAAGRGITPTHAAHTLLPKIKLWLNELRDMQHTASHEHLHVQGHLCFGTSHHIGLHYLSPYLKNYAQCYPQVNLDVRFVDSEQAHEQVLAGDLEMAFLTLPPQCDDRLKYLTLWEDPLIFVVAPFHPLASVKNLTLKDLLTYPSLLPAAKTYTSQITLSAFEQQGLKPKINMRNNPLASIRMLASIGLGWSVLPKTMLNEDLHRLDIDLELKRELGLVWHPNRTPSKAMTALIEMMQKNEFKM